MTVLAIFPLGSVLMPHMPLMLNIFEPRYKVLLFDASKAAEAGLPPQFGVVLIERGVEVGGDDVRFGLGTVATFDQAGETPTGTFQATAVGGARFRIVQWLTDDPYPRAEVELFEEAPFDEAADGGALVAAELAVRRCLRLSADIGEPGWPPDVELDPDPTVAAWQLAGICPLTPLDHLGLIDVTGPGEMLVRLASLATEAAEVLAFRSGGE